MSKQVFTLSLVAMVVMLAVVPVANAQEPDGSAKLRGEGNLTAQGDGMAILGGRGTVDLSGNGILWIQDRAGGAVIEVTGQGEETEFPDGWLQYAGFHGTAHVEGSRIVVIVAGVDVALNARGRGIARLWGHGSYQSSGQSGEWATTGRGARVRLAPPH